MCVCVCVLLFVADIFVVVVVVVPVYLADQMLSSPLSMISYPTYETDKWLSTDVFHEYYTEYTKCRNNFLNVTQHSLFRNTYNDDWQIIRSIEFCPLEVDYPNKARYLQTGFPFIHFALMLLVKQFHKDKEWIQEYRTFYQHMIGVKKPAVQARILKSMNLTRGQPTDGTITNDDYIWSWYQEHNVEPFHSHAQVVKV